MKKVKVLIREVIAHERAYMDATSKSENSQIALTRIEAVARIEILNAVLRALDGDMLDLSIMAGK